MKTNSVFLLLVLAAGQTPKAAAQSPGTFTATGNMTTPRFFHTATLLADGRVLIAGGESFDFKTQASAEFVRSSHRRVYGDWRHDYAPHQAHGHLRRDLPSVAKTCQVNLQRLSNGGGVV